ncbi:phosphoglycerate kinase, partial [Moritella sp.]
KVSTKLTVLDSLSTIADQLVVGGGIANTFIAAQGHNVGKSLCEHDLIDTAKALMAKCDIPVATDVLVATEFSETAEATLKPASEVNDDEMIFDLGPDSANQLAEMIKAAKTIIWNGPVGVFEFANFSKGTEIIGRAIAESDAFSIAGGGDTLAAIDQFGLADGISYISTGGGAFLEFVEGKVLPAVAMLEERAKNA